MAKYAVGLDFGTESARVVAVDVETGRERLTEVAPYRHGVMARQLPSGRALLPEWALHHPGDYLEATAALLRAVGEAVAPDEVVGIGLDATACTVLPTTSDATPLALLGPFQDEPNAYVKLWKHHGAALQAERVAAALGPFMEHTGGVTSAEWLHAKALETYEQAPDVFAAAERYLEVADWLVWQLTGREVRSACHAGYKAHYRDGYPNGALLERIAPGFSALSCKLRPPTAVGTRAGELTQSWAARTGLRAGIPVAVAVIDAHAAVPGLGIAEPGILAVSLGTSTSHLLLSERYQPWPGLFGVVYEGIYPGLYGYETGQTASGDMLAWWVRCLAPGRDETSLYAELERKARSLPPGGRGLLALDWWNGSRTPLMNPNLSGVLVGLRVETRPEEVYRALLEAIAYSNRYTLELLEVSEPIKEIRVCGGLSKNALLMQIMADVTGREIRASTTPYAGARGAAVYGALAAREDRDVAEVCALMAPGDFATYRPRSRDAASYEAFYQAYRQLHDDFGTAKAALISRLKGASTGT
jgi:L-ribulokinase